MTDDVFALGFDAGGFLQHLRLRRREDAVEPAEDSKLQDDLSVFVPLVLAVLPLRFSNPFRFPS